MLKDYEHNAKYYETDQMGCVHHSNYIRWMEEARVDLMDQMGCGYRAMEEAGVCSPVLEVNCRYKSMVRFGDTVRIHAWIKEYNGIRMTIGYEMRDVSSGELRTRAESAHCFLTLDGRPVSLKRSYPEWDKLFRNMLEMEAGKGE
ncbi:acyl-CoA thioesterase [Enterocloster asparagiformis]|uniref:acyl-CoA thioesterase n=1 Tax=Enterocloster asparagiformis TaxID=333367 RepID=UPI0004676E0F|nr:thioesterase family protein [Enterocloster asparagiformis]